MNNEYTFGSKAGEILKHKLNEKQLQLFGCAFHKYCKRMKDAKDIKDRTTWLFIMQLLKSCGKNKVSNLFKRKDFPKELETYAQNCFVYIYRKYLKN